MSEIKIGITDDHQLFRKSLALMIQSFGNYEIVLEAANGARLLTAINPLALPDILLLDVSMPEMDGFETAKRMTKEFPQVKLIALSQNDSEEAIIGMIRAGCCAFMLKDSHPAEFQKCLESVAERGYYAADTGNINMRRLLDFEKEQIKLTEKEKRFLELACSDLTYKQIAAQLNLSEKTIDGYRENLFAKFKVQSRVGLAMDAVRRGFVKL